MDWSITTSFLIGLFVGWLVEYVIDYLFWRRGSNSSEQELRLRLRDAESELTNARTQIRTLQAKLDRVSNQNSFPGGRQAEDAIDDTTI